MVKLNVGCGDRKLYGFVNIDGRSEVSPDVICNISEIDDKFSEVDLIYACHVLEHFPLRPSQFCTLTWSDVLQKFHKCLKKGGTLRIAVPDMEKVCQYYTRSKNLSELFAFFWGGQKYDYDFHYYGWDFHNLKKDLESQGFGDVRRYDWKKTEHFYVDDYSQAYLPHMNKSDGILLSLNVEAVKL